MSRSTERRKPAGSKKRKNTIEYMMQSANSFFSAKYKNNVTASAYRKHFKQYVTWCRDTYKCKSTDECKKHIQDYVDYLVKNGKTASTIHTYIAPICSYFNMNMSEIEKPSRCTSDYTRGRAKPNKYYRADQQYDNADYSYVANFQKMVGIRRAELKHLTFDCFVKDERGYNCILVKRGKGGKRQLQRILPEDVEAVRAYFTTPGDGRMFSANQFSSHMDYHHLRAEQAKRAYKHYYNRIHNADGSLNETEVQKLRSEIQHRWNKYNRNPKTGKAMPLPQMSGTYKLRGKNRDLAVRNGLPVEYDRLCVVATSVYHLSHWRNDVTIASYLLAV